MKSLKPKPDIDYRRLAVLIGPWIILITIGLVWRACDRESSPPDPTPSEASTTTVAPAPEEATTALPATPPEIEGMVFVSGGTFQMGDQFGEGESDEKPVHSVTVSNFYLGKTEVTFAEYDLFCEATGRDKPSDRGWGRGQRPVIFVSWYDAVAYCNWRSEREGRQPVYSGSGENIRADFSANGYRLPTEAEWEYAARSGGDKQKWSGTSTESSLAGYANYRGSDDGYSNTAPVGKKKANGLGLYDMSGNVWEWCWDRRFSGYYDNSPEDNPTGPSTGSYRMGRGGGCLSDPVGCRAANRLAWAPTYSGYIVGFRLALSF